MAMRKVKEAKLFFEQTIKERPDLLLAGSDIYNELRVIYQIIHLCVTEEDKKESGMLDYLEKTKTSHTFNKVNLI